MDDYIKKLRLDLVEQFKDKPVIDALLEVVGEQLNEIRVFYEELNKKRAIDMAVGKQLDGAGDIVVLSRKEAGLLGSITQPMYVITDTEYRKYLYYKIWKNTSNCTYPDLMKAVRIFWSKPLYYKETITSPATIVLETDELSPELDINSIIHLPLPKAGGVGLEILVHVKTPSMNTGLYTACVSVMTISETEMPVRLFI